MNSTQFLAESIAKDLRHQQLQELFGRVQNLFEVADTTKHDEPGGTLSQRILKRQVEPSLE